ncbi:MAG: tetratricopeptide repeat protein [Planctomycetes bacterium]|nr:tetratricopeptide repeat protein [Planctomycetota bacterium]
MNTQLDHLAQQASAALRQQDHATAQAICTEILRHDRAHAGALTMMAHVHTERGFHAEALDCMTRIVKAQPRNAQLRTNFAQLYAAAGQYPKALAQFEKALKLDPNLVVALAGKAAVLERQNKYERAERLLRPHARAGVPDPGIAAVYVRLLTRAERFDDAVEVGRRALASNPPESMPLRDLCFALAKAHELGGDYAAAMDAAHRANAMLAAAWDPDTMRQRVDALIDFFTADRIRSLPRPAVSREEPVFVVGIPRCGSTLTERIIHVHPDARGAGEIPTFARVVNATEERFAAAGPYPGCLAALDADAAGALADVYLDEVTALAPRASRIVDKMLTNFLHLGMINVLLPAARIIHTGRNALDTCLSCYLERLTPASAPWATDLRHLGLYYREYERLMTHWREVLDIRLLEIDYEAIADDQDAAAHRIIEFCGLPWNDACARSHEGRGADTTLSYDQVRRPVYRTSVGRAERFGTLLDPLREALAGETPVR